MDDVRVALLYQAAEPPAVDGVRKPMKPGGYQDSGADIAYALKQDGISVVTPAADPDPTEQAGWSFPDTEAGILEALAKGANLLWANTVCFAAHPLQTSKALDKYAQTTRVVGQPCLLVDRYDDKNYVNSMLRDDGRFLIPKAWIVDRDEPEVMSQLSYPVVGKPIRGRGSHGVRVCHSARELTSHLGEILQESSQVMIEEFLGGQEGTVTVLPPSGNEKGYRALPIVVRFAHMDGVAPYNGVVAVTENSRVPSDEQMRATPAFAEVARQCEGVAEKLRVTAPIRIDVRQTQDEQGAAFAIFDVNMKPDAKDERTRRASAPSRRRAWAGHTNVYSAPSWLLHSLYSSSGVYAEERMEVNDGWWPE